VLSTKSSRLMTSGSEKTRKKYFSVSAIQKLCISISNYYIFTENDFRLTSILSARGGVSAETSSNAELPISVSVLR
jgi:hypothetical protein